MAQAYATPPMAAMTYNPAPAGFWLRFAAYLIDSLLLGIVQAVLALGVLMLDPGDWRALLNLTPVGWALGWAYFALFESSPLRGTVGKHVLGLYVADVRGDPISFGRASARYLLKNLSTLTLMVGWIMAAFTPRKQALHDLLAHTLVLTAVATWRSASPADIANLDDYWDGRRWVSRTPTAGGM